MLFIGSNNTDPVDHTGECTTLPATHVLLCLPLPKGLYFLLWDWWESGGIPVSLEDRSGLSHMLLLLLLWSLLFTLIPPFLLGREDAATSVFLNVIEGNVLYPLSLVLVPRHDPIYKVTEALANLY